MMIPQNKNKRQFVLVGFILFIILITIVIQQGFAYRLMLPKYISLSKIFTRHDQLSTIEFAIKDARNRAGFLTDPQITLLEYAYICESSVFCKLKKQDVYIRLCDFLCLFRAGDMSFSTIGIEYHFNHDDPFLSNVFVVSPVLYSSNRSLINNNFSESTINQILNEFISYPASICSSEEPISLNFRVFYADDTDSLHWQGTVSTGGCYIQYIKVGDSEVQFKPQN